MLLRMNAEMYKSRIYSGSAACWQSEIRSFEYAGEILDDKTICRGTLLRNVQEHSEFNMQNRENESD